MSDFYVFVDNLSSFGSPRHRPARVRGERLSDGKWLE